MSEIKKRSKLINHQDVNNNNVTNEKDVLNASYHKLEVYKRFGIQRLYGEVLVPLALMLIVPLATMVLWHICSVHNGNLSDFIATTTTTTSKSVASLLYEITVAQWKGSMFSVYVIVGYLTWAILLTHYLPGDVYYGPITDKGNTPDYVNNGFKFYLLTLISFIILALGLEYMGYSVTLICDRYGEFMFIINVMSLLFCLFLCVKGKYFPSSTDNGSSGNPIFDYYWGIELYPRIGKIDLKLITNCRWGMMVWALVVILFWMKSLKTYGFVDSHFVTMILIVSYLVSIKIYA